MKSLSATLAQCPCIASAECISIPESSVYEPAFQKNATLAYSNRHQVHPTLSQVGSDLAVLDDALAHITYIQTRLSEKRNALQVFSNKLKALVSLIRIVPPEIFAEIFSYLKGDYRDKAPAQARTETLLPTHVCQRWREIALSTPTLWNNIYINGGSVPKSVRDSEVECTSAWLSRAKDCPLSINLRRSKSWSLDHDFETDGAWNMIFDMLLRRSHRWQHAILLSTSKTDFSGLRNNLPLLETLEINCPLGHVRVAGNAFEIAPRLSSVTLSQGSDIGILPWAQLKIFVTDSTLTLLESLVLLQKIPNIVSFSTRISYEEVEAWRFVNAPLQMSKLESLSMTEIMPLSVDGCLTCLKLPSLKSIKIIGTYPPNAASDNCAFAIMSMIQRSSCSIKSLEVRSAIWGQSALADVLRVTPQLETLDIELGNVYKFGMASKVLVALFGIGTPCLAPKLQHLKLSYWPPFEPQAFVDLLESRWRVAPGGSVTRLSSIKLINIPSVSIFGSSDLQRLREFATEGLDIKLGDIKGRLIQIGSMSA
ncbi:hypothetical protein HWV62_10058 [Athelia sp. TMB]|nr:hypothetical protein HWV62_1963 [Athelia sp. TMB]KAF7975293.1 hypothetical protein HWV62_10058 [Athelia sp. TMB]